MLRNNALFLEKRLVRLYSSVVIFEKKSYRRIQSYKTWRRINTNCSIKTQFSAEI